MGYFVSEEMQCRVEELEVLTGVAGMHMVIGSFDGSWVAMEE